VEGSQLPIVGQKLGLSDLPVQNRAYEGLPTQGQKKNDTASLLQPGKKIVAMGSKNAICTPRLQSSTQVNSVSETDICEAGKLVIAISSNGPPAISEC